MRLALIPQPALSPEMAGPGWRYWRLAEALAAHHLVEVFARPESRCPACGGAACPGCRGFQVRRLGDRAAVRQAATSDAVLTQGARLSPLRDARALEKTRLLLDLYDPLPLELPAHYRARPPRRGTAAARYALAMRRLRFWLERADALVVATARQADLALGMVLGTGSVRLGAGEGALAWERRLITAPLGVTAGPAPSPEDLADAARELPPEGYTLAWAGGTWPWFDGAAAAAAAETLYAADPRYGLLVLGADPPGEAAALAQAGALPPGPAVRRLSGWRSPGQLRALLARCRVALCLAPAGLESRFAYRTRVLDHLAAGIPTVFSGGDELGAEATREGWGIEVAPGDSAALVAAIRRLAEPGPARDQALAAARDAAAQRTWSRAASGLAAYVEAPPPRRPSDLPWWLAVLRHQARRLG